MKKILDFICVVLAFIGCIIVFGAPGGCDQGKLTMGQVFLWELVGFGLFFVVRIVSNIRKIYFK
jgi:hypothetical protein